MGFVRFDTIEVLFLLGPLVVVPLDDDLAGGLVKYDFDFGTVLVAEFPLGAFDIDRRVGDPSGARGVRRWPAHHPDSSTPARHHTAP